MLQLCMVMLNSGSLYYSLDPLHASQADPDLAPAEPAAAAASVAAAGQGARPSPVPSTAAAPLKLAAPCTAAEEAAKAAATVLLARERSAAAMKAACSHENTGAPSVRLKHPRIHLCSSFCSL